ncbi:MAG: hypothetical protein A2268_15660 [Candidatus Raymondbacteria bacterium RifOxyA12_full_50_37]|uniref:ABC-2 type transporter transmembrane domain-containing protein n=1 Tax=Candidatus Raymondbacteria bacterium RIFOXYD12_FULL_49_13 TaxID=1817890 RepID=A0A1F7FL16_UNCRA|nr:MAG: hypothetical protein A2268_15660 [Candidatus Raymondbacteria bacterium RifOxyA12_full_50_37]OGJ86128.1 MAG: hypothetical protein A2248_22260 [Candidatus Raymondbacteria bacterium RIFOXYA2_FULL_49_16]OGJ94729.1 MAG: hypothetical protein A2350_12385 [Candidatus Raymondbacteria bacterium RifOxyB12_full_50_8]OGJ96004.1 MAG: hypothetical protein A2453_05210 [Candidatus Raymondbacteria bacterium RIFOXYC2_FULL_50_21]OGK07405.1 MAG: hypothetical protein A2519_02935 [Candidatus Raymondbacteria b
MIRNIITLTLNDLAIAFKNKTIYLVFFIPFFVFFSLKLVDREDIGPVELNIGLVRDEMADPVILQAIQSAGKALTVSLVSDEKEGVKSLKDRKIDGLLLNSKTREKSLVLVVLKKESVVTLSLVEVFSALQKATEGRNPGWISDIRPLQTGGPQRQTLPTWTLMLVLLVGFLILPAQVAEEKEKKLLLALLQTPMRETEWLAAKVFSGMFLMIVAVLLLHLLGGFCPDNFVGYAAFIAAGGFCFSSFGILLGFLCRNQAGARTLGVMFYLPHLLPSALSDFSHKLTVVAPILPSYQFYKPIKSILLEEGRISKLWPEWAYLILVGLITLSLARHLMKKRWLM